MPDDALSRRFATFLSGYGRRWMESHYDRLMLSPAGQKLRDLDRRQTYVLEVGLYALMAYVEDRWTPGSPFLLAAKKVAMDAPPEVAKRLLNGIRETARADIGKEQSEERRAAIANLLALEDEDLLSLVAWVASSSPEDRRNLARRPSESCLYGRTTEDPERASSLSLADEMLSDLRDLQLRLERRQQRRRGRSR